MSVKIVQLNEGIIKGQIKELVRGSVEETLNELPEKEAESLTQAARYERSEARQGYRNGHYDRNLATTSGDVTLHMPRLKGVSFETASSNGTAAGRAVWRKPSSRCIWRVFPRAGWRPSRRHCGAQGFARYHQRVEQESLRSYRGLAESPLAGRALSIRLRGRHLPAPQLGRRVRKCCCFGGNRCV